MNKKVFAGVLNLFLVVSVFGSTQDSSLLMRLRDALYTAGQKTKEYAENNKLLLGLAFGAVAASGYYYHRGNAPYNYNKILQDPDLVLKNSLLIINKDPLALRALGQAYLVALQNVDMLKAKKIIENALLALPQDKRFLSYVFTSYLPTPSTISSPTDYLNKTDIYTDHGFVTPLIALVIAAENASLAQVRQEDVYELTKMILNAMPIADAVAAEGGIGRSVRRLFALHPSEGSGKFRAIAGMRQAFLERHEVQSNNDFKKTVLGR